MAERPLECSGCTKKAAFDYTESLANNKVRHQMCADCPLLTAKLPAIYATEPINPSQENMLVCDKCHTSLAEIKQGDLLGCKDCYNIFKDALYEELKQRRKIPSAVLAQLGKNPLAVLYPTISDTQIAPPWQQTIGTQITVLSQELNDALGKENYEQAAWIRDQIKALMEKK